jgi:hypothetical protein
LWKYFFSVSLQKKGKKGEDLPVPIGCASIHLRGRRAYKYMATALSKSNKGWHKQWFYLKNDTDAPLVVFTGHLIEEPQESWGWDPVDAKKRRLGDLLKAITLLKRHGLHATGVVGAYHARRVVPLMARVLPLYQMMLKASLEDTVLSREPLCNSEIE